MGHPGKMVALSLIVLVIAAGGLRAGQGAEVQPVAKAVNAFAVDLYGRLAAKEDGNLFMSPFSMSTALAMTYAGARGQTAAQMAEVLHFDFEEAALHAGFRRLLADLAAEKSRKGYQLSTANALWGQKGYGFLAGFLELTRTNYGAGLREVDFIAATDAARKEINEWVEVETQRKIRELIGRGVLNSLTRLVLTNAIYFKGDWASQFDEALTKTEPFKLADGSSADAPLMHQMEDFGYCEFPDFQVLEMHYVGGDVSMVILLPKETAGLGTVEKLLSTENLGQWLSRLRRTKVDVWLPRFKMTSQFSLARMLASMGMTDAFTSAADFSGMNGRKDLFISAVLHKAFVEVNEEGTEAAAATAVGISLSAVPAAPPVFRADHAFLFLIRDTRSKSILFIGRLASPQ